MDPKIIIAKRIAKELKNGEVVNLGIGLPTLVANYVPKDVKIILQSENGMLGLGPAPEPENANPLLTNAGGGVVTCLPGGSFFDSCTSFGIIRGGHVHTTVLGALEVDAEGNLANWKIPGKHVPGMGGAMDLVVGAKNVIVATTHTQKGGGSKVLKRCSLPLTARKQVNMIITELAVMEITVEGLLLKELAAEITVDEIKQLTDAELIIDSSLKTYSV